MQVHRCLKRFGGKIDRLQELCTRMISYAVTEQVDARKAKIPEYVRFEEVVSNNEDNEDIEERKDVK